MTKKSGVSAKPRKKAAPLTVAKKAQEKRLKALQKRERLLPCLVQYGTVIDRLRADGDKYPERSAMAYLTDILRGTYQTVLGQIAAAGKTGISAQNAVKRSAGTNFQGLCEYAVLKWLQTNDLPIAVGPNAPKSMKDELTIYGQDADAGEFSVEPDIDISLWIPDGNPTSPILFLSAKTSLVDRAGQAARWKLYLDLHQTTCTYVKAVADCPIHRTQIKIKTQHTIVHSIVTANIYKIDTTQPHGELTSGQCRNNTYMFKYKFTTRNDAQEVRPSAWESFSAFPSLIESVFQPYLDAQQQVAPLSSQPGIQQAIPLEPIVS